MKNQIFKTSFLIFLSVVILCSCSTDDVKMTDCSSQDEFTIKELTNEASYWSSIQNSHQERSILYAEIEKQFDGDNNVLLKNLSKSLADNASNLRYAAYSSAIEDSISLYPQLFIPFYESLKANNRIGTTDPTIVIYTDETSDGLYDGYKFNNEGKLELLEFQIGENYAKNNEVWVFSVNERVDMNGEVKSKYSPPESGQIIGQSGLEPIIEQTINNSNMGNLRTAACVNAPQFTSAIPQIPHSILLKWAEVDGASYYKLYRQTNYSGEHIEILNRSATLSPNWSDMNLIDGTYYDYYVKAFGPDGCASLWSNSIGARPSWRTGMAMEKLNQLYISDHCWAWCCGWPEGDSEFEFKAVRYNKQDQLVELPNVALGKRSKSSQKGKWFVYDKDIFRWDYEKYAYNYMLYFYEDDGGDGKGTTITLSASFKPIDSVSVTAEVQFTLDDKDEQLGWVEIYHFDPQGKEYSLSPRSGSAKIKIRQ